jgi:hypothetical protein
MAHAQKTDFVFLRKRRVHLNRQGRQFSRLLAAEVCASAVVMLDTPSYEVVWRVLATHSIRQFPLHLTPVRQRVPSRFNWNLLCADGRTRSNRQTNRPPVNPATSLSPDGSLWTIVVIWWQSIVQTLFTRHQYKMPTERKRLVRPHATSGMAR